MCTLSYRLQFGSWTAFRFTSSPWRSIVAVRQSHRSDRTDVPSIDELQQCTGDSAILNVYVLEGLMRRLVVQIFKTRPVDPINPLPAPQLVPERGCLWTQRPYKIEHPTSWRPANFPNPRQHALSYGSLPLPLCIGSCITHKGAALPLRGSASKLLLSR